MILPDLKGLTSIYLIDLTRFSIFEILISRKVNGITVCAFTKHHHVIQTHSSMAILADDALLVDSNTSLHCKWDHFMTASRSKNANSMDDRIQGHFCTEEALMDRPDHNEEMKFTVSTE